MVKISPKELISKYRTGERDFSGIELPRNANLMRTNFNGADFYRATFIGTNLWWTDLSRANFEDAYLRKACLVGANLSDTNLRGADLRGADLRDTYLMWAKPNETNLIGADLRGADLRDTYLRKAKFYEALGEILILNTLIPDGLIF